MKIAHILMLTIFASGMGLGQLLFKLSALRQSINTDSSLLLRLLSLFSDWPFLLGLVLYASLTVYWIWLLTFLPLSRAYPFTFLSLAIATIGSALLAEQKMGWKARFDLEDMCRDTWRHQSMNLKDYQK